MKRFAVTLSFVSLSCCALFVTPRTASAQDLPPGWTRTQVRIDTIRPIVPFTPATSDSAINAFRFDIAPEESGGECRLYRYPAMNGRPPRSTVWAFFPTYDAYSRSVLLWFDSAGTLTQFNEGRTERPPVKSTPGMSDEEKRSITRAAAMMPRASITFVYTRDSAVAQMGGVGGLPRDGIVGTVKRFEALDALGPVPKTIARVRKLCGV